MKVLSHLSMLLVLLIAVPAMLTPISRAHAFELVYEAQSAQLFAQPHDITLSPDRRYLYVADTYNNCIVRYRIIE